MKSASGRYVIVFNGEIYNFRSIRNQLETQSNPPIRFRGHSDTEVMLAAIEQWGVETAVKQFNGMFAFALWDTIDQQLTLCRDRLGEKPLYYGIVGSSLIFGSELKVLRAHPNFKPTIDRNNLTLFLRHGCVPGPYSIYEGIHKLPPGTILTMNVCPSSDGFNPHQPTAYWDLAASVRGSLSRNENSRLTDAQYVDNLNELMRKSIGERMVADVPLGAFLSGGIDSSTIVAIMQSLSARKVKTFSIAFHEGEYNEADDARLVAQHLGTDHTELCVSPEQALKVVPKLSELYDEPFADPSQIPTFLVAELARKSVTVGLSGDGGDEIFGGYSRYTLGESIRSRATRMPPLVRRAIAGAIRSRSPQSLDALYKLVGPILPKNLRQRHAAAKLIKMAEVIGQPTEQEMFMAMISHWKDPSKLVQGAEEPKTILQNAESWDLGGNFISKMMYMDSMTYLPDDILVKVDRATMGVSLEARVPFLDHEIVEFAWDLPMNMKVRDGQGKYIVRQLLNKYVPKELTDRPKMGFNVPTGSWLRGPLNEWAEHLLCEKRLSDEGFFEVEPIRKCWIEHQSGRRDHQNDLWPILMFQSWLENT